MKPLLASQLISALSIPKKGIARYIDGKYARSMTREMQIKLIDAHKFVISDELLIQATKLSYLSPKELLAQIEYVKPPFENVWFEWNEHTRIKTNRDELLKFSDKVQPLDFTDSPERIGYHVQKVYDEFLYTCYFKNQNDNTGRFVSPEMGFTIHDHEYNWEDYKTQFKKHNPDTETYLDEKLYNQSIVQNGVVMLGEPYCNIYQDHFPYITNLMRYLSPTQTASTHWSRTSEDFEKPITQKDADEHFIHLNMLTGDGRFIIALLSLLNAQITTAERVIPNPKIIHTQFLKRVPRNEYKVLSINLSEKHIRKVYKSRSTNIKQKQHHRRGHWRHYKSGKKTWINNYLAGDPNLGKIVKDYNFKMEIKNGE